MWSLEFASLVFDGGALALFHWLVSFVQDCLLASVFLFLCLHSVLLCLSLLFSSASCNRPA